jgi:hypothetical protein
MEKNIPNSNTVTSENTRARKDTGNTNPLLTQRNLTTEELERHQAMIAADIKKNREE